METIVWNSLTTCRPWWYHKAWIVALLWCYCKFRHWNPHKRSRSIAQSHNSVVRRPLLGVRRSHCWCKGLQLDWGSRLPEPVYQNIWPTVLVRSFREHLPITTSVDNDLPIIWESELSIKCREIAYHRNATRNGRSIYLPDLSTVRREGWIITFSYMQEDKKE